MIGSGPADGEQILELVALHKYFLNADFLRDVFMRRIKRDQPPDATDPVTSMDDLIAMSLWYATVYVVIEGWRGANLADAELDALLADSHVDRLRRFRNQVFTTSASTTIRGCLSSWGKTMPTLTRRRSGSSGPTKL